MLYNVIADGDSVSYIPTTLGKVALAAVFFALLAAAVFFAGKKSAGSKSLSDAAESKTASGRKGASARLSAKQLAFCAMAIALGTVLSNLKIYEFPFGGSITLFSMLIICLPGYWFGPEAGLITGVAYGVLQLIIDPYVIHPVQLLVDYPLAFGALGLSGLFTDRKNGLLKGYATGIVGRWIFVTISGWIFFAEYAWDGWAPLPYSLVYNGIYIFAEAAVTCILLAIPAVRRTFAKVKQMAVAS
nr:energy-coupled thiamine transporter ThiT [uncultured Acetatifactor sp.]